jgi:anaerobic selenocysteine-containing dehydrogenase
MTQRRHFATCPLCEATCGITVDVAEDGSIASVRGDELDPFSRGYICPKAHGLVALHSDPDRLRRPLRRRGGDFVELSWDEALAEATDRLISVRKRHGADAVAVHLGNQTAHNLDTNMYGAVL